MGSFDDLIPQADQTQSNVDQSQIANKSLSRKQQNKPTSVGEDTGFSTGLSDELFSLVNDLFAGSESIRTAGLQALRGNKEQAAKDVKTAVGNVVDATDERAELGGVFSEMGLTDTPLEGSDFFGGPLDVASNIAEKKPAATAGLLTDLATDPLNLLMGGGAAKVAGKLKTPAQAIEKQFAKTAGKEFVEQVSKESVEAASSKVTRTAFDLTPEKTLDDFVKLKNAKQNELLAIDKDPNLGFKDKNLAKSKIANELDDVQYEAIINEMSDFSNDITKRTIFKNPNPLTSLVQTYISNKGQFGGALYRQAERASDVMDALRAKWFTAFDQRGNLPKVFSNLSKNQRSNFMAAMEGFEDTADPVVKHLVDIARTNRADIAEGAIKRGVQIRDINSSTAKFFSIKKDHMPHYVIDPKQVLTDATVVKESLEYSVRTGRFKDMGEAQKVYDAYASATKNNVTGMDLKVTQENKAFFEWMVKNKQAENIPDAVKRFQFTQDEIKTPKSGSLETQRIVDIPFYDTNPERVLTRYYSSVGKRFGEIDNFGRNNEIANKLIDGIRKEFGDKDAERVSSMINLMTGSIRPSDLGSTTAQVLRDIEITRKLSLAVMMNITQSGNTAAVTGLNNANKALFGAFTKEGRDYAYKAGVLFSEMARTMYGVSDDLITGKIANAVLNVTGFNEVEKTNRVISALAGKHFANEQAMKYIASNGTNETAARSLRNMGLSPDSILKRGSLKEEDMLRASRYITNRTQFRSRVLDSPEWANSPWGKLVNQFKNYSENQVRFLREELLNEAKQGNYAPIVRYGVIAPAIYTGAKAMKDAIRGKDRRLDVRTDWQKAAEVAANMGMFGMYYDIIQSMNFKGQGWVAGLIPALDTIGQGGSAVFEAIRPLANQMLGKEEAKLLNLKPLTRFAAQSTPIFGYRLTEALKEPEDKQKQASKTLTEAAQRGIELGPIIEALREDKRINVPKALKSVRTSQKRQATKARKANIAIEQADDAKRALIKLGLVSVPRGK